MIVLAAIATFNAEAQQTETTVSTFECISLYWSPEGGSYDKDVLVTFREKGASEWKTGLNMKYNPQNSDYDGGDYRGSIVNLTPDTEYEIELALEGTSTKVTYTEKTWPENFPVGRTIYPGKLEEQLTLYNSDSGTKDGYILYDGQGDTIDVNNNDDACIFIQASYIIIRNYVLTGGKKYGIFLADDIHDIVIENCDISNWGEIMDDGFGTQQGAIQATRYGSYDCGVFKSDLARIVVQRNKIHHPRSDANSWAEGRGDPVNYHPIGPQAVMFLNSAGNHVIRYNEVWSDADHYYNDIIGYGCNQDWTGFPGPDSDIYGNYLANCWDEPIETEGGGRNVRIWGNYVEEGYLPIAAASTRLGPIYAWRNVSGRTFTPEGSKYGPYQPFFKQEYFEGGFKYLFNNTILQPDDHGAGGLATKENLNLSMENFITRNNILHVRSDCRNSIGTYTPKGFCDFDYDLFSANVPDGYEANGISGSPSYAGVGFDRTTMTGDYSLLNGTPGHDDGVVVPNFIEKFEGTAPDIGASEVGAPVLEYGVNANECMDKVNLTSSSENGQVNPPAGSFCKGTTVQFTATPDRGYEFDSWGGDLSGADTQSVSVVMNSDMNVTAIFKNLPVYSLVTETDGNGHVSSAANGDYYEGEVVKITAFPDWQESFLRWEGDLSGTENPVTITVDSNINIVAVFTGATGIFDKNAGGNSLQIYPNPFTDVTTIQYELVKSVKAKLSVFDLAGKEVAVIVSEQNKMAGTYEIQWSGDSKKGGKLPNGTYVVKLEVDSNNVVTNKLILNR